VGTKTWKPKIGKSVKITDVIAKKSAASPEYKRATEASFAAHEVASRLKKMNQTPNSRTLKQL
jgi:hypothetical protein